MITSLGPTTTTGTPRRSLAAIPHCWSRAQSCAPCSSRSAAAALHGGPTPTAARQRRPRAAGARVEASTAPAADRVAGLHLEMPGKSCNQVTTVFKFGGSSVASAERMLEVARIVCRFPEHLPCVVLSAMGKTTNLLLEAGQRALEAPPGAVAALPPLVAVKALHRATAEELGVGPAARREVEALLTELEQLLTGISIMKEITPRAKDSLVSFGERLSVRLFAALLTAQGCPARPHDAPALGLATTDDFGNAAVLYDLALPALRAGLTQPPAGPRHIPVLTGFLGCGAKSGAVTTLGRGGSDLTATLVGAALGLPEVVLWKDIDGVQTTDPRVVAAARRVPSLTFEEASELSYFGACVLHPLAMVPAAEAPGGMAVRVMNSYNAGAAGTRITAQRDVAGAPAVTALVLKEQVTLIDVSSTKMFGTFGFLARVFGVFEAQQVSVDMIASSEVSVSLTLDPARLWERDLIDDELEALMSDFAGWATASHRRGFAILSLICALDRTNDVLARAFTVLGREGVRVHMISQGSSKPSISLVIRDADAKRALHALHDEYFPPAPR